jgi:circadian clock protein KaiC
MEVSYLADTVVLFRHFEAEGALHQAVSILKKRSGQHERTIRELYLGAGGISAGPPLHHFRGVLTGVPELLGQALPTTENPR